VKFMVIKNKLNFIQFNFILVLQHLIYTTGPSQKYIVNATSKLRVEIKLKFWFNRHRNGTKFRQIFNFISTLFQR